MLRKLFRKELLLVGAVLMASTLQGQDLSKGSIYGVVRDASGARQPGVTVFVLSQFGEWSTMSGPTGEYYFLNLPPGESYTITAGGDAFQQVRVENVVVHAGRTTVVDFTVGSKSTAEAVISAGEQRALDFASPQASAYVNARLFQNLPLIRNQAALPGITPGVLETGPGGPAGHSFSGGHTFENLYLLNGVNLTDPGFGGLGPAKSAFGPSGFAWNPDALEEVQVIQAGAGAAYGQSLGGIISISPKTGGNSFHGSLFGHFQPRDFEAARPNPNRETVTQRAWITNQSRYDGGAELGGPLIRNQLTFYGLFNPQWLRSYRLAPPASENNRLGEVAEKPRTYNYFARFNWRPAAKHQFDASVSGDPTRAPMGFARLYSLAADNDWAMSELHYGSRLWNVRYTGSLTPNLLVTAGYGNLFNEFRERPKYDFYQVVDLTRAQRGMGGPLLRGGLGLLENTESRSNQVNASASYRGNFRGTHLLQFGYQFEQADYDRLMRFSGAAFALPADTALGSAAGQIQYGAALVRRYLNPGDSTSPVVLETWAGNYSPPLMTGWNRYQAFWAEDTWNLSSRVTLRPGLRFEKQRIRGYDINPSFGDNWAPRIGVAIDPDGKRNSKLFAGWGRLFERIPASLAVRYATGEWNVRGVWYRDQAGNPDLSPANYTGSAYSGQQLLFTGSPSLRMLITGEPKPTYQDEVTAGYERSFGTSLTFTARFIYRDLKAVLEDASPLTVTDYRNGKPLQLSLSNPSADFNAFRAGERFFDPNRTYRGLEVLVNKRFSRNWQMLANYRLAKLTGNYEGLYPAGAGMLAPLTSSLFDFSLADGALPYQGTTGVLPLDRRHMLKVYGSYHFSSGRLNGLSLAAGWNASSGAPLTQYIAHPAYDFVAAIPSAVRGGLGWTDWTYPLDFKAGYSLNLSEGRSLKFGAEFFNLFNQKTLLRVDQLSQLGWSTPNPDFLKPDSRSFANPYQTPFQARLSIRFEF